MEAYILQNSQKEPSNQGRAHSNVMKKFAGLRNVWSPATSLSTLTQLYNINFDLVGFVSSENSENVSICSIGLRKNLKLSGGDKKWLQN